MNPFTLSPAARPQVRYHLDVTMLIPQSKHAEQLDHLRARVVELEATCGRQLTKHSKDSAEIVVVLPCSLW